MFEYAFHKGVQLAILTDGQEWNFFLPGEQGDYGERRLYKLDIIEREIEECTRRLKRYLKYESYLTGIAINAAREDYRNVSREREMKSTLPLAWKQLVEAEDELLLELLSDKVESLCGYKPDPDTVASFLKAYVNLPSNSPAPYISSQRPRIPALAPALSQINQPLITIGFSIDGKHYSARNASEVLVKVLETLTARDPSFPERFASLPKHGRTRRYLSRSSDDLYPGRPDLARDHSRKLSSGWWLSTNHSRATIRKIIEMACHVSSIQIDRDLTVKLGE